MRIKDFITAGFWGSIGLIGGISAVFLLILGVLFLVFIFTDTKDKIGYNIKQFLSSKEERALSDNWYINSFNLCEKNLLDRIPNSSTYKRLSKDTIGDNEYKKMHMWSYKTENSFIGDDFYSATCVVDKIKKSVRVDYELRP